MSTAICAGHVGCDLQTDEGFCQALILHEECQIPPRGMKKSKRWRCRVRSSIKGLVCSSIVGLGAEPSDICFFMQFVCRKQARPRTSMFNIHYDVQY